MNERNRAALAWAGGAALVAALCGYIGFQSDRPHSSAMGVATAVVSTIVMFAGHHAWRRAARRGDVSSWEYAASALVVAWWSTMFIVVLAERGEIGDGLFLLPPVGVLPLLVRRLLGDHGEGSVRARVAARRLHQFAAIVLGSMGTLYAISLYLIVLAPIPLIAASLHVAAVGDYRRIAGDLPTDPRLGFMK